MQARFTLTSKQLFQRTKPSSTTPTAFLPLQTDLEVADREVDRLENTVADLRDQLQEARGGGCGGGDGEEKSDCMLSAKTRHQYEVKELLCRQS